jgi:hypothetical protein
MPIALSDVRFWGKSRHRAGTPQCPLLTIADMASHAGLTAV